MVPVAHLRTRDPRRRPTPTEWRTRLPVARPSRDCDERAPSITEQSTRGPDCKYLGTLFNLGFSYRWKLT